MSISSDFQKIGEAKLPNERQIALQQNERIWFFGQKFVDQPNFNFGHYVVFGGGYSTFFDTTTSKWTDLGEFSAISNEENQAEVLFVFHAQIFLLLYVHFGDLLVKSLYKFSAESKKFELFGNIQTTDNNQIIVDEESKDIKHDLVLVDGEGENGVYFLSFVGHQIRLHQLVIPDSGASPEWQIVSEIPDSVNVMRIVPTKAALINGTIYIQGGVHGCGFRWQPLALICYELVDKSSKFLEIENESNKPSFGFTGSLANLRSQDSWTHLAGYNAAGMTGTAFNGQIWTIKDLDNNTPKWQKSKFEIPDPKSPNLHIIYDSDTQYLFVFNDNLGVLKASFLP